jgi:hypothetical protein
MESFVKPGIRGLKFKQIPVSTGLTPGPIVIPGPFADRQGDCYTGLFYLADHIRYHFPGVEKVIP